MKVIEFEGVRHEFPPDFTDADIAKALASLPPRPGPTSTPDGGPGIPFGTLAPPEVRRHLGPDPMLSKAAEHVPPLISTLAPRPTRPPMPGLREYSLSGGDERAAHNEAIRNRVASYLDALGATVGWGVLKALPRAGAATKATTTAERATDVPPTAETLGDAARAALEAPSAPLTSVAGRLEDATRTLNMRMQALAATPAKGRRAQLVDPVTGAPMSREAYRELLADSMVHIEQLRAMAHLDPVESTARAVLRAAPATRPGTITQAESTHRTLEAAMETAVGGMPTRTPFGRTRYVARGDRIVEDPGRLARPLDLGQAGQRRAAQHTGGALPDIPAPGPRVPRGMESFPDATGPVVRDLGRTSAQAMDAAHLRGLGGLERVLYTVLGHLESLGPHGAGISRLIRMAGMDTHLWYGRNVAPLVKAVRALSPAEQRNLYEVLDQGGVPMSENVRGILVAYDRVFGEQGIIAREATSRGLTLMDTATGQTIPWQARPGRYFPREWEPEVVRDILRPGSRTERAMVRSMMARGQATSEAEARAKIARYFKGTYTDRRAGGLEYTRELDIDGYITDPAQAIARRGWRVARRFAELEHYGHDHVHVQRLVRAMEQQGNPDAAGTANRLFQSLLYRDPSEIAVRKWVQAALTFESATKLPLAFIPNLSQTALTALRTDLRTAAEAFGRSVLAPRRSREAAEQLGVLVDVSLRQLLAEMRGGGTGGAVTQFALAAFNAAEQFNRIVGTKAGFMWADKIERMLARPTPWLRRELARLDFTPEEITAILARRHFMPGEKDRIAFTITDQTQYVLRMPRRSEFFNSDLGHLMGQFKHFILNTGRLMNQVVLKEARHGNFAPLAKLLVPLPIAGEIVADARAWVRGSTRPNTFIARYLDNLFAVASLGIASEYLLALGESDTPQRAAEYILGPFFSDVLRLSQIGMKATFGPEYYRREKAWQDLLLWGVRQVPYAGPRVASELQTGPRADWRRSLTPAQRLFPPNDPWEERAEFRRERSWHRNRPAWMP